MSFSARRSSAHSLPRQISKSFKQLAGVTLFGLAAIAGLPQAHAQSAQLKPTARPAGASMRAKSPVKVQEANAAQPSIVDAQPVAHARSAAISACLPAIAELSRMTLDAPHMALSTWNKAEANDHMFSSIAGLKYDNAIAPRAIAIMSAAPNAKRACDGEAIQVQPSSLSCEAIQKNVANANLKAQDLNGVTLIQGDGPLRFALLPTSGNGCAVVAIGTYYAK